MAQTTGQSIDVEGEIRAALEHRTLMLKQHNIDGFISNLSDNFTVRDQGHAMGTCADLILQLRHEWDDQHKVKSAQVRLESLRFVEGMHEAVLVTSTRMVYEKRDPARGERHELENNCMWREYWVRGRDGWNVHSIDELEHGPFYRDGEPISREQSTLHPE